MEKLGALDGGAPMSHVNFKNFFIFFILCFTSYFIFSTAGLPHSPGVVYNHLLFRRETRIPGVAPLLFSNRILGSFCA